MVLRSAIVLCLFHNSAEAALMLLMPSQKWVEDRLVFVVLFCLFLEKMVKS